MSLHSLLAVAALVVCGTAWAASPIRLTAGAGRLTGATTRATTRPGHSGAGYVTGFVGDGDAVAFRFSAAAGVYDASLVYASPGGHKGARLRADGVTHDVMLPGTDEGWATADVGRVELVDGPNELSVGGGWGHYDVDAVTLTPAAIARPARPLAALCDPLATPAARTLMRRLVDGYGTATASGGYGEAEEAFVADHAGGRRPAMWGGDLMDFSPSRVARGADGAGMIAGALRHAAAGQAVTLSWHWNAPAGLVDSPQDEAARWYRGFNAKASTFDLAIAMAHPSSVEYGLVLRDIDAIAAPLKRLADASVPVLWRPLHEGDGQWFWWGAKGPGPFVSLWRLMHDRLTRVHGLHNLIWVYSYTDRADRRFYPGDRYVDVVGVDAYPSDNHDVLGQSWLDAERIGPGKLRAVTEFDGVPDVGRMHRLGYPWAYFVSWHEPNGPAKTGAAEVRRRYEDAQAIGLAEWAERH